MSLHINIIDRHICVYIASTKLKNRVGVFQEFVF